MSQRPQSLIDGLSNRCSNKKQSDADLRDAIQKLQLENSKLSNDMQRLELENRIVLEKNAKLEQENIEFLQVKLEEEMRKKDAVIKIKSKGKLKDLFYNLQEKVKGRPSNDKINDAAEPKKKVYYNESCFSTFLNMVTLDKEHKWVPKVLVECVTLLESSKTFMEHAGLYRSSGSYSDIQKLRASIGSNSFTLLHEQTDPHNITGIIKMFFRDLYKPIISLELVNQVISKKEFLDCNVKQQIEKVKYLIKLLQPINRETIKYFVQHLERVADIQENLMNADSLAICVSGCIFYDCTLDDYVIPTRCLELMISYNKELF